jgi:hypothetical protein
MRRTNRTSLVFVLFVGLIVAVGFSRGWFTVTSSEDSAANEVHVNLTVDRGKFQKDAERAVEETRNKASHLSHSIKPGASPSNDPVHDRTAAMPPNNGPDHL